MAASILSLTARTAPASDPDRQLVRRMADGDVDAHRELYERYARGLLSYLAARLDDDAAAEELLHDVMLAAWHAARTFRGESSVRTWLLVIAHHRACNELRRRGRLVPVASPEAVTAARTGEGGRHAVAGVDSRIDLEAAFARLPDEQRAALELVFVHGLSQDEAARVLGVPSGTVKSRLHRAKARLRHVLAPRSEGEGGRAE